jgi:hypothetical protein
MVWFSVVRSVVDATDATKRGSSWWTARFVVIFSFRCDIIVFGRLGSRNIQIVYRFP